MKTMAALLIIVLLVGCATALAEPVRGPYWAGDPKTLRRDHYECKVDAIAEALSRPQPQLELGVIMPVLRGFAVGNSFSIPIGSPANIYPQCMRTRGHTLVVSEEWANRTNESIARGIAQQCRDEVATRGVAIEEAVGGSPLYRGCVERAERGTDVITPIAAPLGAISLDEALSTR